LEHPEPQPSLVDSWLATPVRNRKHERMAMGNGKWEKMNEGNFAMLFFTTKKCCNSFFSSKPCFCRLEFLPPTLLGTLLGLR